MLEIDGAIGHLSYLQALVSILFFSTESLGLVRVNLEAWWAASLTEAPCFAGVPGHLMGICALGFAPLGMHSPHPLYIAALKITFR